MSAGGPVGDDPACGDPSWDHTAHDDLLLDEPLVQEPLLEGPPREGPPLEDTELLDLHLAGDPHAFGVLFQRNSGRAWAVAIGILGDREDAADAVQDAMLSAYRTAGSFRGDAAVSTWLHRIVVNACLDRLRRRRTRPTVPLTETEERTHAAPGDAIGQREDRIVISDALARLPDAQRLAVILVDLEGRPVAEVAIILGVPVGTVKSRCARGRAQLAVTLGYLRPGNPTASANVSVRGRSSNVGRAADVTEGVIGGDVQP